MYIDENGYGYAATVALILGGYPRPTLNLSILKHNGHVAPRVQVEPASHDGIKWIKMNKWAFIDEIPKEEWDFTEYKYRLVGGAGTQHYVK